MMRKYKLKKLFCSLSSKLIYLKHKLKKIQECNFVIYSLSRRNNIKVFFNNVIEKNI